MILEYLINIYSDKHFAYIFFAYLFVIVSFIGVFISARIRHKNIVKTLIRKIYKNNI